jgi:methylated-DNA-protein-cysteine methyltransferase related protein
MMRRKESNTFFNSLRIEGSRSRRRTGADNSALEAIWEVVSAIPPGQVSTYGAVAEAAGLPGRARQTGYALRVAPAEMSLPWHRVVGAGGRIAFSKSSRACKEQVARLREEGVLVRNGYVSGFDSCGFSGEAR